MQIDYSALKIKWVTTLELNNHSGLAATVCEAVHVNQLIPFPKHILLTYADGGLTPAMRLDQRVGSMPKLDILVLIKSDFLR